MCYNINYGVLKDDLSDRIGVSMQVGAASLYFLRHFVISKATRTLILIIPFILAGVVFAQKKSTGFVVAGRALKGFPNGSPSALTGACVSTYRQVRLNS